MNKKNYIWIGIGLVVVIGVIYLLISLTKSNNPTQGNTGVNQAGNNQIGTTTDLAGGVAKQEKISPEVILEVDGANFTPKTITVAEGTRAFMTFSAKDDKQHILASDDPKLPLLVVFSKKEGIKSTSFETPPAGSYTFYVDDKANTGTFIVK